ncbi:hypothetical protein DV515_00009864 [Chloebia gouldiae]|uniref:Uncharacterized protein n=1 Tax=Chloebia gouldiae TaxID=44316 RepID=A0A3L8SBC2_CHLGU|nr:hypothetical protein DV515_00009864 [Chloebia gouldiae]
MPEERQKGMKTKQTFSVDSGQEQGQDNFLPKHHLRRTQMERISLAGRRATTTTPLAEQASFFASEEQKWKADCSTLLKAPGRAVLLRVSKEPAANMSQLSGKHQPAKVTLILSICVTETEKQAHPSKNRCLFMNKQTIKALGEMEYSGPTNSEQLQQGTVLAAATTTKRQNPSSYLSRSIKRSAV